MYEPVKEPATAAIVAGGGIVFDARPLLRVCRRILREPDVVRVVGGEADDGAGPGAGRCWRSAVQSHVSQRQHRGEEREHGGRDDVGRLVRVRVGLGLG
eukprot:scaffold118784_cov69-Phaeocystis_antarctica.AAC.1